MKSTKVRAQQIIMTVGCIGFLVWVGFRGMNERQGSTKHTDTVETKQVPLATGGTHIKEISEEIVVVNQTYSTTMASLPLQTIRASQEGEVVQVKIDVNSRIEVGQEIAVLRVAQGDTTGLSKATRKVKESQQHVKEQLDQLLAIDRGEEGTEAKDKYEKQYTQYNEAKKELAGYEEKIKRITTSPALTYVEKTIKSNQTGIVKQVLVGAGRVIEVNSPLFTLQNGQTQVVQIEVTSENYLLLRDHLQQVRAHLVFQDQSTYQLPATVIATLNQKSISEEGKIRMTLDVSSIPNRQDIRNLVLSILNIPTKVFDENAIFMRDNTAYIWTLNEENEAVATPVVIVKKENGKVYVHKGNAAWNHIIVGDLSAVTEGQKFEK